MCDVSARPPWPVRTVWYRNQINTNSEAGSPPRTDNKPWHVRCAGQGCYLSCEGSCDWWRTLPVTAQKRPTRFRRRCGLLAKRRWISAEFFRPVFGHIDWLSSPWLWIGDFLSWPCWVWVSTDKLSLTFACSLTAFLCCHTWLRVPRVDPPRSNLRVYASFALFLSDKPNPNFRKQQTVAYCF